MGSIGEPQADVYGPGSFVDYNALPVPDDARRVFEMLATATPGFTKDESVWDNVDFHGSPNNIAPGPLKSPVIASALHAMCGIVANELLALKDESLSPSVSVNTDHAALWLGTVGMTKRNGQTVREIAKAGKLSSIFEKDLEKDTFGTPLRLRATAVYPTKDPGVWYQLHGSLGADPVLRMVGVDPNMPCDGLEDAYRIIAEHVKNFGANELEMLNFTAGLCGSINYTPEGWRQTRMSRELSKHPLINYSEQTYAVPTPKVPLPLASGDHRPLAGIKVVEIVRIIAGPVIGTTLAALGADVIRVNCSRLADFNSLQLTLNAGVRTLDIDFSKEGELAFLMSLIQEADIFIQGYRPGVIARRGMSLHDLLEMASNRGKGIVYVEENCYGPDGPMYDRPGWQQVADAASGCSYVTGRALGHTDGTCVLPALPVPDMMTGLIGAIGAMMAIRDRARNGGSYHVFASLMAAAAYPLHPTVGLYSPEAVKLCNKTFNWDQTTPAMFVLELLDVVLKGWKEVYPQWFADDSPFVTKLDGSWGRFDVLKPVVQLANPKVSPYYSAAPEANCHHASGAISWLR